MASKPPRIAPEEWERHKDTIKGLWAHKTMLEVKKDMEDIHQFVASKSQYELQLKKWELRKNFKQTQWANHLASINGKQVPTSLLTSSGHVKNRKQVERGKRYLKQRGHVQEARPIEPRQDTVLAVSAEIPERGVLPDSRGTQNNTISQPQPPMTLDNSWQTLGTSSEWHDSSHYTNLLSPSPFLHSPTNSSGPFFMRENATSPTASTTRALDLDPLTDYLSANDNGDSSCVAVQSLPEEWAYDSTGLGGLDHTDIDDHSFLEIPLQLVGPLRPSGNPLADNDIYLQHSVSAQSDGAWTGRNSPSGLKMDWLNSLPSVKVEAFLSIKGIVLTSKRNSVSRSSLSASFAIKEVFDMLYNSDKNSTPQIDRAKTAFRMMRALLPVTAGAVISEQQITESNMIQMLLFSILNNFAGLNDMPVKTLLPCLRRLKLLDTSFLEMLVGAPRHASRTLTGNLFRAAIEAKDEQIIQALLLRHPCLADTVFWFHGDKVTALSMAAFHQAFSIVRMLVECGAKVDKTYTERLHVSYTALSSLLRGAIVPTPPGLGPRRMLSSPELVDTVRLLIENGSKVTLSILNMTLKEDIASPELGVLLSEAISPSDHRGFWGKPQFAPKFLVALVIETASMSHAETSASIMETMVRNCQSEHSGTCLAEDPGVIEEAAVQAAMRGRLEVLKHLIDYVKSEDLILSAAIRSGNQDLVHFLLRRNRDLNPPARNLPPLLDPCQLQRDRLSANGNPDILTTPLAESIRTENGEITNLLETESCGTFASLTEHGRLKAMILAAAEVGHISYLRRLLRIASSTKVKFRVPERAITCALVNGHEEVASLLIKEGASLLIKEGAEWDTIDYRYSGPVPGSISSLPTALAKRYPEIVAAILATDIDTLAAVLSGTTAAALKWAEPSILKSLLYVMPDMNMPLPLNKRKGGSQGTLRDFCLHCMETQSLDLFRLFIESTSAAKDDLEDCLAVAIQERHHQMILYLLEKGANPSKPEVLMAAIPHGTEMLSLLFGNDVQDRQQARGCLRCVGANALKSLLSESSADGRAQILDKLLEMEAVNLMVPEVVKTEDRYKRNRSVTPLGLAILGASGQCITNVAAIHKFLQAGADPNGIAQLENRPYRCKTALMAAIETGREDVVTLVIDKGADVNLQPRLSLRRTPLQYAAELGNLDMIRLLLRKGADVNSPAAFQGGGTALQFAAISGNCNIVAELLKHGASLDVLPSKVDGRWPLEGAAEHGRLDMIQLLWDAREHPPLEVGFGERQCLRAMDLARENGHFGCMDLIAELSELLVDMLDTEDYGVPWLAY